MNRSVVVALVLSVLVVLWLLSGTLGSDDPALQQGTSVDSEQTSEAPLFKVTVRAMTAEPVAETITLQGVVDPARSITVKAETQGRINAILVKNGARVAAQTSLATIATDDRQARLEQAIAELKLREAELEAANQLKTKKLISGNQLEQAIANVAAARAAVKQIRVELGHTNIRAAFAGIVNDRHVELGDYVSAGDPILELIDDAYVKLVARVPQQHIGKLNNGQILSAELLDGTSIDGALTYISSNADPATRTFRVEAKAEPNESVRLGQSARIRLTLGELQAHRIPSSILSLAADGRIFVNAVNDENKVVRHTVEIIKQDNDGVWVSGLPASLRLIVLGQAFVTEGQVVEPNNEGEA